MYNNFSEDLFSCSHQKSLHEIKIKHIAEGRDLVDLSMINPDMQPERILLDKLLEATVKNTNHRYSVSKGIKRLRAAFAHKYSTAFSVNLNHDKNICITMGSKDAIVNTMLVLSAEYKYALLPSPTYPALLSAVHLAGMQPVYYDICLSEDLILKEIEEKIKKVGKAVLVLNFPNNPSGKTVTADFYMGLKKILKGSDTVVLNDFVYGEMGFDGSRQTSLLSIFAEHPLLLESYSLSKAYSIPGWRVGAVMGNASFIEKLANLKSHMDYGVFLPLQIAACKTL